MDNGGFQNAAVGVAQADTVARTQAAQEKRALAEQFRKEADAIPAAASSETPSVLPVSAVDAAAI